jgi:hypothetical protein
VLFLLHRLSPTGRLARLSVRSKPA